MAVPSPPSPAFSPVYFGDEENDGDSNDFRATNSVLDASNVPDVDTIDNSRSHSIISPAARQILLGDDFDDDEEEIDDGFVTIRKMPPLDDYEDEETRWQDDNHHSLPNPEELKLSVAAAAGGGSSFFSSPIMKKIVVPAIVFLVALAIVLFSVLGAENGADNNQLPTNTNDNLDEIVETPIEEKSPLENRALQLQNYMIKYGITSADKFYGMESSAVNTPQSQAIRWMANEDNQFPSFPTDDEDPTTIEGYALVSRYAMVVFYFATEGKNWDNSMGFLNPDKQTCDWYHVFPPPKGEAGVLCNQTTKRIIGLSLISNNLKGYFPSELSHVTSLEYLESIENPIVGPIPMDWQRLTGLRTLVLPFNELTGNLPSWMPRAWPDMEFLYLSNNVFSGTIPEEFLEFRQLSVLALDDNILTGKTDVIWNSMQSLEFAYLEDNDFTGTLPSDVSKFNSVLINLDVSSNRLSGALPEDLFQLNHLEILDLHDNQFDSTIPQTIPENNDRMKFVALHRNGLTGTIPSTMANLRRLSHLDVTSNQLTGTIPYELEKLSDVMTYLFLGANNYQEGPIPSLVYALTNLRELSLKSSKRTGPIAGVISALDALLVLDLDDNALTGSIPNEIGTLTNLQFLLLNRNQLSSSVPGDSLANLAKLRFLLLDNNHLYGDLNPICGLDSLTKVYVDCGEIDCLEGCCSCCMDGKTCHDNILISSHDPVWEAEYTRQFFDFSESDGGKFYANRDDDYWQ